MKFDTPTTTVLYSIEQAIKVYRKLCQENISKIIPDITVDQALILMILDDQPELSQSKIANLVFKDHASITRIVGLMVNKNYLLRKQSKGDKRRIILKISAKGKRAIKLLAPTILQNRKTALGGISLKDLSQLSSTLNKIIDNCKEKTNVEAKIKIKN